jgi:hypothetical protein
MARLEDAAIGKWFKEEGAGGELLEVIEYVHAVPGRYSHAPEQAILLLIDNAYLVVHSRFQFFVKSLVKVQGHGVGEQHMMWYK